MSERLTKIDLGLLLSTLLLLGLGVVLVYSSSFAVAEQKFGGADFFLARQITRGLLGVACFVVFINIDYHLVGKYGHIAYFIAIAFLLYVLVSPHSRVVNGAKRWVEFGFIRFQVSEFARLALIIMLSRTLQDLGEKIREGKTLMMVIGKVMGICGLIVLEPDFSTAVLIGTLAMLLIFMAGANFWHLSGLVLAAAPAMIMAVASTPYRRRRVLGFLQMSSHKEDIGYQSYQALVGLGNGGLFGVGLGQGGQKLFYLPEPHTDFVFSIIGEEVGFVGILVVLAIFVFMVYRGLRVALRAPDKMGQLLAFGITLALAGYVLLHACVNIGIVPTTGVPLPFLSYGGMNLVFTMSAMGILLNISSQTRIPAFPGKARSKAGGGRRKRF